MPSYLRAPDHFDHLIGLLPDTEHSLYHQLRHNRTESVHEGRQFVVYSYPGEMHVKDVLTASYLQVDSDCGAWFKLHSRKHQSEILVDYQPIRVWNYDFMVWLPLHLKLCWDVEKSPKGDLINGCLSFPLVIRTQSRYSLYESDVDYVETMQDFHKEFGQCNLSV